MDSPKPLTHEQRRLMESLDIIPELIKRSETHIQSGSCMMSDRDAAMDLLDLPQLAVCTGHVVPAVESRIFSFQTSSDTAVTGSPTD